jgi:dipeptidyl aminopeptidase/acylaminoacyl peptidase
VTLIKPKLKQIVLGVIALAFVVQIGIVVFNSMNARQFTGVRLNDTNYEEVFFHNDAQSIDLAGMLFLPEGEGPFPGVVVIHGSGPSMRANGWYLTLTKHLQDSGIAVLLPDKRGSEKSGGDWRSADYEDLATDTLAALNFLRSESELPLSQIGIVGMSEGGKYSSLVATMDGNLDFIVNVVGSAVLPKEQLQFEENYNLQQMGIPPGISYVVALLSTAQIRYMREPEFWSKVSDFDPNFYWSQIKARSLVLYGEDDTNVPSRESERRLEALENPNIRVIVYEDSGHALEDPPSQGNSIFRSEALNEISRFVLMDSENNL